MLRRRIRPSPGRSSATDQPPWREASSRNSPSHVYVVIAVGRAASPGCRPFRCWWRSGHARTTSSAHGYRRPMNGGCWSIPSTLRPSRRDSLLPVESFVAERSAPTRWRWSRLRGGPSRSGQTGPPERGRGRSRSGATRGRQGLRQTRQFPSHEVSAVQPEVLMKSAQVRLSHDDTGAADREWPIGRHLCGRPASGCSSPSVRVDTGC